MTCPLCAVAVGAGVGVLRYYGVDDIISGLWAGALILSIAIWMINWFNKKNINFKFKKIIVIVGLYALTIIPLYYYGFMGLEGNLIFGFDRLGFGIFIGTILLLLSMWSDKYIRRLNEGKVAVYYQKVIIPLIYLIIASIFAYMLLKITGA